MATYAEMLVATGELHPGCYEHGHIWTKVPSTSAAQHGQMRYVCARPGCDAADTVTPDMAWQFDPKHAWPKPWHRR